MAPFCIMLVKFVARLPKFRVRCVWRKIYMATGKTFEAKKSSSEMLQFFKRTFPIVKHLCHGLYAQQCVYALYSANIKISKFHSICICFKAYLSIWTSKWSSVVLRIRKLKATLNLKTENLTLADPEKRCRSTRLADCNRIELGIMTHGQWLTALHSLCEFIATSKWQATRSSAG